MRRFLLITAFLALPAWSDVIITSGSIFAHIYGIDEAQFGAAWNPTFSGTNFSITGGDPSLNPVFQTNHAQCVFATATCSYNFTQTSVAVAGPAFNGTTFTYNGIAYPSPDEIIFFFNFQSSTVSAPAISCFVFQHFDQLCEAPAFGPVPFTMTGSFQIKDAGNNVLASDTISGSGVVSTSATNGVLEGTMTYEFTAVPEPASVGLVGAGLLLTGWLASRKRAQA